MLDASLTAEVLKQAQRKAYIQELAVEFAFTPDEIEAEAEAILTYYAEHGRYPVDVEAAYRFYHAHDRLPTLEEWEASCQAEVANSLEP